MNAKKAAIVVGILAIVGISYWRLTSNSNSKPRIAFILKTVQNPFFIDMKQGAENYIAENRLSEKYDVDIKAGKSEKDVEGQRQLLEQCIAGGYDVVCVTPTSSKSLNNTLAKAMRSGIKVVVVDTKLETEDLERQGLSVSAYVGSDNETGGKLAAEFILKNVKDKKPRIIFFEGVPDQETAQKRKSGFLKALAEQNVELVDQAIADWNKEKAFEMMGVMVSKGIQFDAVFASNDQMALGVIEALEKNQINPRNKIIVGFDAIPDAVRAIGDSRRLTATIRQKPRDMGSIAMQIAVSIIGKKPFEKDNPIQVELVD